MPLPHHSKARSSDRSAQTVPPVMAIVGLWRGRAGTDRTAVHGWSSAVTASPTGFQHGERGGSTEFSGGFNQIVSLATFGYCVRFARSAILFFSVELRVSFLFP